MNLQIIALIAAILFPGIGLIVAIARGFARMEVRFAELRSVISQHAVDLLRVESDLRADLQEIRIAINSNHKDHEDRIREIERRLFRLVTDEKP